MREELQPMGAYVTTVGTRAEALALRESFDVSFVEHSLPGSAGERTLTELAERGTMSCGFLLSTNDEIECESSGQWRRLRWPLKSERIADLVEAVFQGVEGEVERG